MVFFATREHAMHTEVVVGYSWRKNNSVVDLEPGEPLRNQLSGLQCSRERNWTVQMFLRCFFSLV